MIRTRDFAKIKFSRSTESLVDGNNKEDASDVISLSSDEEKPLVKPKSRKKRERKPKIANSPGRKLRKWKTPLKANYSKITDFFGKTKNDAKLEQSDVKASIKFDTVDTESGVTRMTDSDVEIIEDDVMPMPSTSSAALESAQSDITIPANPHRRNPPVKLKKLTVVLERLDMTSYVNGEVLPMDTRKHWVSTDQSKLDGFVEQKKSNNVGYFDTYQDSALPLPGNSMVRIEDIEMTRERIKDEPMIIDHVEDTAAEPTVANIVSSPKHVSGNDENDKNVENITVALLEHNPPNTEAQNEGDACMETIANGGPMSLQSSLLVEESFGPPASINSDGSNKNIDINQNHTKKQTRKTKQKPQPAVPKLPKKKKKGTVPSYKIIENTNLAVDAFRYGDIEGVQHYFLSHFHADHYIGLKKSFNHDLYLSEITERLVHTFIKVDKKYMHPMQLQTAIVVEDVEVTALDANHCPGAVMFLFKLTTGKCILHTGDFRASPEMEEYPEFWNNSIDCIYLDTTYLSKKYAFQSQIDSISEVKLQCGEFLKKNETVGKERCLIVCGAYKIGKEKVWMSIADEFGFKVYIDKERRKAMECLDDPNVLSKLSPNPNEANIHVLPLGNLSYQQMAQYLQYYNDNFQVLLAVRPSGWESKARKPKFTSNVTLLGVQYSEHSSYNELERFVKFLQPKKVISTVPMNHGNQDKTTKVPAAWTNVTTIKPSREPHQPTIQDMFRKSNQTVEPRASTSFEINVDPGIMPSKSEECSKEKEQGTEPSCSKDSNLPRIPSNATIQEISSDTDYMP